jgi:hypothetical protein
VFPAPEGASGSRFRASSRTEAQRRIYRLELDRIRAVDAWLEPYRDMWSKHLDALESHLDRRKDQ